MESEFETPAKEAILKVIGGEKLKQSDWDRLTLFLAAQDVRTPTSYLDSVQQWEKDIPPLLDEVIKESLQNLENRNKSNRKKRNPHKLNKKKTDFYNDILKVQIIPNAIPEEKKSLIKAEVVLGRKLWLESQKSLLNKTAQILKQHKWSIAEPAKGNHWFTSDHPVVRLNHYGNGHYDLKGGWGNKKTNLIMPLSPQHLLFTQIGDENADRLTFSPKITFELQRVIAERSYRWIFSHREMGLVKRFKPRVVDPAAFESESKQRRAWHEAQCKAEG